MKKLYSILSITLTVLALNVHAQWQDVGTVNDTMILAGWPDIAFDPSNDQPNVSYNQSVFIDGASLAYYTGSNWTYHGAQNFSPGPALYSVLEFNTSTNEPYVAFADNTQLDKASVMKYDGTSWSYVGSSAFTSDTIRGISLSFHPTTNEPWVAFTAEGDGGKISVMKFDGTNWVYVGGQAFSAGDGGMTALEFHPSTYEPYIVYYDNSIGVVAQKFDGTNWVSLATFPNLSSAIHDAEFSPSGELHVLFADHLNGKLASVAKYDGSVWSYVGLEGFSGDPCPSIAVLQGEALAFNSSGTPYVALRLDADDNNNTADDLVVMSYNGSAWATLGSTIHSGVSMGYSLAISASNEPHIVWSDTQDNLIVHVQKYASSGSAPNPPTNLMASLQKTASTNVQLTWTDNSSDEDGFYIERSTDGTNFSQVGSVLADVTTYDDNGLQANTLYYYQVQAYNSFGSSAYSNVEQIMTTITAINNHEIEGISVYPNPAFGSFVINANGEWLDEINLTDLSGRLVKAYNTQASNFSLEDVAEGIYVLSLRKGESLNRYKLVVK